LDAVGNPANGFTDPARLGHEVVEFQMMDVH
jgi:hypothetical protein